MKLYTTLCIFFLSAHTILAQSPQAQRIWEIAQAGNWTQFNSSGMFTIGILQNKALKKELEAFLKDKKIAGKAIDVRRFDMQIEIKPVNILFIDGESTQNTFIDGVKQKASRGNFPALIVTAKGKMLEDGSHINLINNAAQYEINLPEVQKSGISLNTGSMRQAVLRNVQVKDIETNNISLDLRRKKETGGGGGEAENSQETQKNKQIRTTNDKGAPISQNDILLEKAAKGKNLNDKQINALRTYIQSLEQMLNANKIDYQSLKKQYDTDQAKAEEEIEDLNLTLIELDSLHKKDSLLTHQALALVQSKNKTAQAEARTSLYVALAAALLALLGIGTAYLAYRDRQIIAKEKHKSDTLLLNILPAETAQELKDKGHATPRQYELVTVLFTDFKGFTNVAETMSPEDIVRELDNCFLAFDEIVEKYNLERIKTIGDSYMCAGGVPTVNKTNPADAVKAGLEMQAFMQKLKAQRQAEGKPYFECRLGIHSGKVVAGVVGKKKFAYDIWGDTVNVASRMESSGEVNKINISADTYTLIKDNFTCEHRGKINAKGKGEIDMYFVHA